MKRVSIIIPAYNLENYIERCLQSCLDQTYKNWEAIIVNDGSTDNTLNVINQFIRNEARFKLIDQLNSGLPRTREVGIENATGDYIYFLDGDDFLFNETLDSCVSKIALSGADIVVHDSIAIWDSGKKVLGKHKIPQNISGLLMLKD